MSIYVRMCLCLLDFRPLLVDHPQALGISQQTVHEETEKEHIPGNNEKKMVRTRRGKDVGKLLRQLDCTGEWVNIHRRLCSGVHTHSPLQWKMIGN